MRKTLLEEDSSISYGDILSKVGYLFSNAQLKVSKYEVHDKNIYLKGHQLCKVHTSKIIRMQNEVHDKNLKEHQIKGIYSMSINFT